ncbi:MAG TPA: nucleoside hydrolase [Levilinea sp.]|nr:nucleoside hydrolase [Levilinea sp.]
MAIKILIDTDPGVDDAMAILFALRSPELEVVALTTVFGNAPVELTTQNALRLLELEGNSHIPVARGADFPLVRSRGELGMHVHGDDGMGGLNLPPPKGAPAAIPAAQLIVDTVMANPGEITLLPLGPLSNIGLALLLEPAIARNVKEVILMGGSAYDRGNASPAAEANIYNDPEAAALVFNAAWPLTMVGLDATHRCVMTQTYLDELYRASNPAIELIRKILPFYQRFHDSIYAMNGGIHTHDPSAVAYAIDPTLFVTRQMPIYVETEGRCAGDTVPDAHGKWKQGPLATVCLDVDAQRLLALYQARLVS